MKNRLQLLFLVTLASLTLTALAGCSDDSAEDDDGNNGQGPADTGPDCPSGCGENELRVLDSAAVCGFTCVPMEDETDAGLLDSDMCQPCADDEQRIDRRNDPNNPCGYTCRPRSTTNPDAGGENDSGIAEVCNNLFDDDQDGLIDCRDPECDDELFCGGTYLRLNDRTTSPEEGYPGADIDAVLLIKDDGEPIPLESAVAFVDEEAPANDTTVDGMLGAAEDDADCDLNAPESFYSLGGAGSGIIGSFGEGVRIEPGDVVRVIELGATECGEFEDDAYEVQVGFSDDVDGQWRDAGMGDGTTDVTINLR